MGFLKRVFGGKKQLSEAEREEALKKLASTPGGRAILDGMLAAAGEEVQRCTGDGNPICPHCSAALRVAPEHRKGSGTLEICSHALECPKCGKLLCWTPAKASQ